MLIEDAIVRLEGEGKGGYMYAPPLIYPWSFHTFFIYGKEKWCFSFSNYLDNAKKEESGKCFRLSTVKRKLNLN